VSERGSWLQVRAAGTDLLLSTLDLREVVVSAPVAPLPGPSRGIRGVVFYQGEFLPVLAWEDLPGCEGPPGKTTAMAVLRPRLGLPIERVVGTVTPPPGSWGEVDEKDGAGAWLGGTCHMGGLELRLVDPDRLIALLHRFRGDR
jgi:chemotaxis signal transduction protein